MSSSTESLSASQEGLCSMKLAIPFWVLNNIYVQLLLHKFNDPVMR